MNCAKVLEEQINILQELQRKILKEDTSLLYIKAPVMKNLSELVLNYTRNLYEIYMDGRKNDIKNSEEGE